MIMTSGHHKHSIDEKLFEAGLLDAEEPGIAYLTFHGFAIIDMN